MCSPLSTLPYQTTRDTTKLTCLQQPSHKNNHLSIMLPVTQLYLPAYIKHYKKQPPVYNTTRQNCTYLSTAITLQKQPPVYHTNGDITILTCLNQPTYNNNLLSTILPETQLYFPANSNNLKITTISIPFNQRHNLHTSLQ